MLFKKNGGDEQKTNTDWFDIKMYKLKSSAAISCTKNQVKNTQVTSVEYDLHIDYFYPSKLARYFNRFFFFKYKRKWKKSFIKTTYTTIFENKKEISCILDGKEKAAE